MMESKSTATNGNKIRRKISFRERETPKESKEKRPEAVKPVRYKPIPITRMAEETRYSVAEVKFLYRAFKQECPTGISSEEKFKDI